MEEEIYQAALLISGVNPDVIAVGCTLGSFVRGPTYDKELGRKIARLTKTKAITTSMAVIDAFQTLKIRKVAVATPYTDEVNGKEKEFLEAHGITVTQMKGLGYRESVKVYPLASRPVSGIGLLDPVVAYKLAKDVDSPEAEGIFISCTNLRTIEIIHPLEENARKPIITSNQATMALALKLIGVKEKIKNFGTLLEQCFS
jgi:maleate isomerase